jgi:hypothetical protein
MAFGTYCTQIDANGSGRERCGGACLASCLLDDGWNSDPWALTVQVSDACGITDKGCTSSQLIACADMHGLDGRLWYGWDEASTALAAGEAVLCLLDNKFMIPRTYPMGYGWEAMHWVRVIVHSSRDDMAYVYDPLTYQIQRDGSIFQGPIASTAAGLVAAIQQTPYTEAGVILTSRQGKNLNAR